MSATDQETDEGAPAPPAGKPGASLATWASSLPADEANELADTWEVGAQSDAEAPTERRQGELEEELAREGHTWELDRAGVIERLRLHMQRDEAYLARRLRRGRRTPTDDAIAGDLRVFALAIRYLTERCNE